MPQAFQSNSYSFYTVSAASLTNFFIYDLNTNFGQFPFTAAPSTELEATLLSFGVPATVGLPANTNSLYFGVEINQAIGDSDLPISRIELVVSTPWSFSATATVVTAAADPRFFVLASSNSSLYLNQTLYRMPAILNYTVDTPN